MIRIIPRASQVLPQVEEEECSVNTVFFRYVSHQAKLKMFSKRPQEVKRFRKELFPNRITTDGFYCKFVDEGSSYILMR